MGNFAQQSLPLSDLVVLTIQRINDTKPVTVVVCSLSFLNSHKNFLAFLQSCLIVPESVRPPSLSPILLLGVPKTVLPLMERMVSISTRRLQPPAVQVT